MKMCSLFCCEARVVVRNVDEQLYNIEENKQVYDYKLSFSSEISRCNIYTILALCGIAFCGHSNRNGGPPPQGYPN